MQGNHGAAKILIIISSVVLLTSIFVAFLFFGNKDDVDIDNKEAIEKSLLIDERAGGVVPENVSITLSSGNFARGKLIDSRDGKEKDFYAIKIGEVWRIVEVTSSKVSCERYARLGFSDAFISDCKLSFSDAVSVSEIDATLDDLFLSSVELQIIGVVESIENTEDGQIITVSSGGSTTQIYLSPEDQITEVGDLIVTTITAPQQYVYNNESAASDIVFDSSNTVVVNEDDRDLIVDNNPQENIQNPVTVDPNTNSIFKIDAPKTSAPPSYFFNVYDVDNSFVNVEIDGSF